MVTLVKDRVFSIPRVSPGLPSVPVKRFSLEEYHRYIQLGLLQKEDRVELLNGWMVAKMPTDPLHSSLTARLSRLLYFTLGLESDWVIRPGSPITIPASQSEPEPDLVVAKPSTDAYYNRHPHPEDIVLLVEISNTSLKFDKGEKLIAYAIAKIPVYWVINLIRKQVEVYTSPRGGKDPGYEDFASYKRGDTIELKLTKSEKYDIAVNDILP